MRRLRLGEERKTEKRKKEKKKEETTVVKYNGLPNPIGRP